MWKILEKNGIKCYRTPTLSIDRGRTTTKQNITLWNPFSLELCVSALCACKLNLYIAKLACVNFLHSHFLNSSSFLFLFLVFIWRKFVYACYILEDDVLGYTASFSLRYLHFTRIWIFLR